MGRRSWAGQAGRSIPNTLGRDPAQPILFVFMAGGRPTRPDPPARISWVMPRPALSCFTRMGGGPDQSITFSTQDINTYCPHNSAPRTTRFDGSRPDDLFVRPPRHPKHQEQQHLLPLLHLVFQIHSLLCCTTDYRSFVAREQIQPQEWFGLWFPYHNAMPIPGSTTAFPKKNAPANFGTKVATV